MYTKKIMYFAFSRELSSGITNHCYYARCTAFSSLRVSWNFTTGYMYTGSIYMYIHTHTHIYIDSLSYLQKS